MSEDRFELALRRTLDELAPTDVPVELRWAILDVPNARRLSGRRRGSDGFVGLFGRRVPRLAWALLVLAALVALVGGVIASGTFHRPTAPPTGLARPGLIAFDAFGRIVVTDSDGRHRRQISPGAQTEIAATWSPDGTLLAFWRASGGWKDDLRSWAIVIGDPDGSNQTAIPTGASLPAGNGDQWAFGAPGTLAWAPDSRRIAFSALDSGTPHVRVLLRDDSSVHTIGNAQLPAADPSWSSDGRQIAFHGGMTPETDGVYVMNADGTGASRISSAGADPISYYPNAPRWSFFTPRWQPGGDLIAYSVKRAGVTHVYVAHANGSGERDLSAVSGAGSLSDAWPSWSPDGARIAFIRDGRQIVIVDPMGHHAVSPSHPPIGEQAVVWSPDGRSIVASLNDDAAAYGNGLVVIDLTGATEAWWIDAFDNALADWQRLAP